MPQLDAVIDAVGHKESRRQVVSLAAFACQKAHYNTGQPVSEKPQRTTSSRNESSSPAFMTPHYFLPTAVVTEQPTRVLHGKTLQHLAKLRYVPACGLNSKWFMPRRSRSWFSTCRLAHMWNRKYLREAP